MRKAFLIILIVLALMGLVTIALNFIPERIESTGENYEEGALIVCFKKEIEADEAIKNVKHKGDQVGAVLTTEPMVISVSLSEGQDVEEAAAKYKADNAVDYAQPNYSYSTE